MPKKNNRAKQISTNTNQNNNHKVEANKKLLKEEVEYLITDPINRDNLISTAIESENIRIFELFRKNNGKLTAKEALENFNHIVVNDRVDILQYFVETLKLNLNEPQENLTPVLHLSVIWKAKKCTEYLISKNFDLNKVDGHELKPIEYAILYKNTEIVKLLLQKGASIDSSVLFNLEKIYAPEAALKLLNFIPDQLLRLSLSASYSYIIGDIKVNKDSHKISRNQKELFLKSIVNIREQSKVNEDYCKLILGNEYHLLSRVLEKQQKFIDDKVSQLHNINHDTDNKNIIKNILYVISDTIKIYKIFKFNDREKLENYIITTLEQNKNFSEYFLHKLVAFCFDLMKENHNTGKYLEAVKYANLIEENLAAIEAFSTKDKSNILRDLGFVYANSNFLKALDYLNKAELLYSNDDIIRSKYNIYLNEMKDFHAALREAEKIIDSDLKSLMLIFAHKNILISQDVLAFNKILLQYNFNDLSPNKFKNDIFKTKIYYTIKAKIHDNAGEYQLSSDIYDKLLKQAAGVNNNIAFLEVVNNYLLTFFPQKDWSGGCKFLDTIYRNYPNIMNKHNIV